MENAPLSARQQQIAGLLAKGKSNKEIAFELKITEGTVKQHLFTLFRKLGVTNRLQATIKANELLFAKPKEVPADDGLSDSYLATLPKDYAWRLVTVVHIRIEGKEAKTTKKASANEENGQISLLFKKAQALAAIYQASVSFVPEKQIVATFGAPKSHLDDASRAVIFGRMLTRFMSEKMNLSACVGIATTTTLVSFSDEPLYQSDAYRLAKDLSDNAAEDQILATDLSCKMAGPLFSYKRYETEQDHRRFIVKEVLWADAAGSQPARERVQLPFFNEVVTKASAGQTQWIKIRGWPPTGCTQLLDILALHGRAQNLRVGAMRLPSKVTAEGLIKNLHHQLYLLGLLKILPGKEAAIREIDGDSHKFIAALAQATNANVTTLLLFYGAESLNIFTKLMQSADLTEISQLPLVIAATGEMAQATPELVVELLENHPIATGKHLTYHLKLPESLQVPDGLARDLGTLLEMISPPARKAIQVYVADKKVEIRANGSDAALEIGKELLVSGLFKLKGDSLICRDTATLQALEQFFAQR